MKVYHVSEKVKKLYIAAGVFFLILAAAVFILRPMPYTKISLNLAFYIFAAGLAYLHMTRHLTYRMYVDDTEIYCYNGLLHVSRIPLNEIEKIEYRPNARILVRTNRKNRIYKLLNVITEEDLTEFLDSVKEKKKNIRIIRLDESVDGKEGVWERE